VVRQRPAKPLSGGSIPPRASKNPATLVNFVKTAGRTSIELFLGFAKDDLFLAGLSADGVLEFQIVQTERDEFVVRDLWCAISAKLGVASPAEPR
jgi:hypothetical protein